MTDGGCVRSMELAIKSVHRVTQKTHSKQWDPNQKLGHYTTGYPYAFEAEGNGTTLQKTKRFQEAAKIELLCPRLTKCSDVTFESKEIA